MRRMERGEKALEATINSAKEISFTIVSMTISLAAVFIPLVFHVRAWWAASFVSSPSPLLSRSSHRGLVSLTLTPLMCARLLKERGEGAKKTWVERVIGGIEKRVLGVYGRSLWWFLRFRWVSALIWVVCLAGTIWLFMVVPKAFLPVGDSSFVWGVMIGREGSSPTEMRNLQDRADELIRQDPAVAATFTMTGNTHSSRRIRDCSSPFSSRPTIERRFKRWRAV